MIPDRCHLAIVGAGPAGLAAATAAAAHGLEVALIDEQPSPGGQIYRAVTTTPVRARHVLGEDYWHGEKLVNAFDGSGALYLPSTTVWAVTPDMSGFEIGLSHAGAARLLAARHVILATGAQERPFPIAGWTLPGVMTAGAAQILLKTAGLVPEGPTVLAGNGPLLYLIAAQLGAVGARIECLLDTTPGGRWRDAWRHAHDFLTSPYAAKGFRLLRAAQARTRVIKGVDALAAVGDGRLEIVRFTAEGKSHDIPAATLLLHQGVVPSINLANAMGCAQRWDPAQRCFAPIVDAWGASSLPGVTIAGDAAGIGGARAAEARGVLAALHAVQTLGRIVPAQRDAAAADARRALGRWMKGRAFVDALYQPAPQYVAPRGDIVVCRCEEVTAAQIADAIRLGCTGPNQMKSFVRCGMGPCQGRFCGLTVTELMARERGVSPADVGHYRLRFPVKPITLAELAAMPQTAASADAVVRVPKPA